MKTIKVTSDEFAKLHQLQVERGWKRLAFSTNYMEDIWPAIRFGPVPNEEREKLGGVFAMLDEIVAEYLKVRPEGGRFFIREGGAWFEPEGYAPTQIVGLEIL